MAQKIFTDQSWNEFATGISALKAKSDGTNIAYGTCSTAAATAAKVITTVGDTEWNLKAGSFITIMFSATNTAKNPTFNVNGTGAKNVFYTTTQITSSNLSYAGYANRPMNFMYDGTQYRFIGWGADSNSDTKVNQQELTSNSDRSILLGSNNTTAAATTGTYKSTKFKYNPSTDVLTVGTVKGNLNGTATNAGTATYAKNAGAASALSGLTATVTELNYVDGVTSAIQTQLNAKVSTSRKINGKELTDDVNIGWNDLSDIPFGEKRTEEVIYSQNTITLTNGTVLLNIDNSHTFKAGDIVIVNWNGTVYECRVKFGCGNLYAGSTEYVTGVGDGIPFAIIFGDAVLAVGSYETPVPTSAIFALYKVKSELTSLDKKYIFPINYYDLDNIPTKFGQKLSSYNFGDGIPDVSFEALDLIWYKVSDFTPSYDELLTTEFVVNLDSAITFSPSAVDFLVNQNDCSAFLISSINMGFFIAYQSGNLSTVVGEANAPEVGVYMAYAKESIPPESLTVQLSYIDKKYIEHNHDFKISDGILILSTT